jgi:ribose transport system ATP-binding protein
VHALLGHNGSGKSTLIKTLSGYHLPDRVREASLDGGDLAFGSASAAHQHGCRFVHQDLGLIESETVADNLGLTAGFPVRRGRIDRGELRARTRAALAQLGVEIDPDVAVSTLLPVHRTILAVARALSASEAPEPGGRAEVRLLVLDEPTAALPREEANQLLTVMRRAASRGIPVLFVTHHLQEVYAIADDVTVLRDGVVVHSSAVADVERAELVAHVVGETGPRPDRVARRRGTGAPVLDITDLRAPGLRGLDLRVRAKEVVGIAGLTGSGRDAVLPTVFGAHPRRAGAVIVGGSALRSGTPRDAVDAGVGYLPADRIRLGAVMSLCARENVVLADVTRHWRLPALRRHDEDMEAREWFGRLQVRPGDGLELPLTSFSGGNQQKVLLAKWLRCQPKVLLLDEPTQGVDVGAKAELHHHIQFAAAAGAAVVIASSDEGELAELCDRVLVLREGRVSAELVGPELTPGGIAREIVGGTLEVAS